MIGSGEETGLGRQSPLERAVRSGENADLPGPCGRLDAEQGQGRGRFICRGNRGCSCADHL